MFEKINKEELITSPESPQKSDVERSVKDNEERMTTIIEDLMEQFANNFNLLHSKEMKGHKYNAIHKEENMTNGVVLNILNDEETKNAKSFSEEDEEEIFVVTKRDIHEFEDK
jgi:hypothetical protein